MMPLTIGFCPKPVDLTKALIFVAAPLLIGAAFAYLPAFAAAPAAAPGAAAGGAAAGGAAAGGAAAGAGAGAAAAGGVAAGGAAASGAITALETITVTGAGIGAGSAAATVATVAAGAVAPWASQNVFGSQFTGQQSVNPSDFGAQQSAPQFKEQLIKLAKEKAIDYGTDRAMQIVGEYYAEKLQAKMAKEQEAALLAEMQAAQREYENLLAAGKSPAAARQEAVQSGKFGIAAIALAALAAVLLLRR